MVPLLLIHSLEAVCQLSENNTQYISQAQSSKFEDERVRFFSAITGWMTLFVLSDSAYS